MEERTITREQYIIEQLSTENRNFRMQIADLEFSVLILKQKNENLKKEINCLKESQESEDK